MIRPVLILSAFLLIAPAFLAGQSSVHVEPSDLHGPRPLAPETQTGVIHDYLDAWSSLSAALEENRADLLNRDFVGVARNKLAQTMQEQVQAQLRTHYRVRSHDIRIVFYSPEGLSIELVDNIEYDEELFDHDQLVTTQPIRARYVAVLTPSEVRWRVRVLQSEAQ
jgi:hypothetical protein